MPDVSQIGIVFVHGGQHTGGCWSRTVAEIERQAPGTPTLAVDLPGRGAEPGDLATLTIGECVESAIRQIDRAGIERLVLVGHSMAGITLPGVAQRLGADRIAHMIYVACCVPPQGTTVVSTLKPPVSWIAGSMARLQKVSRPLPGPAARWMFANGMSKEDRALVVAGLVKESATVTREPVDRSAMPDLPTTWVLTLRDNSLKPAAQRAFAQNLGNVDEIIEIDACHNVMMSEPQELARIILARR